MCFYYILLALGFSSNTHFIFFRWICPAYIYWHNSSLNLHFSSLLILFSSNSQYLCHKLPDLFKENGPKRLIDSACPGSPVQPCPVSSHYWNSLSDAQPLSPSDTFKRNHVFILNSLTALYCYYIICQAQQRITLPYVINLGTSLCNEMQSFIKCSEPTNSHRCIL